MTEQHSRRKKHIPQRSCVACRQKQDKRSLTRLVRTIDAGIYIDPTGKKNGRGAYLCNNRCCWEKAVNGSLLDKALRTTLTQTDRTTLTNHILTLKT